MLCGIITWLWEPIDSDGEPMEGRIYNPQNGRTYSASLKLRSPDILEVKGCVLIVWDSRPYLCADACVPTTMSAFVLFTIAISSPCSAAGTLNLSSVLRKSANIACHSFSEMFRCACAAFMSRPAYLHGPPVTWQTSAVTWNFNPCFGTRSRAW